MTYIDPADLPKNRRVSPRATKPALVASVDMAVWQDGFGVGFFFGVVALGGLFWALS